MFGCTILQVFDANIKLCFKMACLLGRVQTSLALLSLHFAIATPKINFCHLPVGTVRVRCNEGVPQGTPSLGFIAEL